jgi:predicted acylesterase/phospholipase RssA/CRP-like cAMP-binding protein
MIDMALDSPSHLSNVTEDLRRSHLCAGLGSEEIGLIAASVKTVQYKSGQTICRYNEPGDALFIVAEGRIKCSLEQETDSYRLLEYVGRGEHFGELAMLTDGLYAATARAVSDAVLLRLEQRDFHRLMTEVPGFAANLSRALGFRLHGKSQTRRRRHRPQTVALVRCTLRTQGLVDLLAKDLAERGNRLTVISDRWHEQTGSQNYEVECIGDQVTRSEHPGWLRQRLGQLSDQRDRILLDVAQSDLETALPAMLAQCEEIWWLAEPRYEQAARKTLTTMLLAFPHLADRIHVVWILEEERGFSPFSWSDLGIDPLDFKVVLPDDPQADSRNRRHGVNRLARHLQGTRIGLALGGGGARGYAHLGVLRAMDRAGIDFDLLAGTSSGALMGLSYASGWDPHEALLEFSKALTPHWLLRNMPGGHHWYLYIMFRSGAWDRMLRPYIGDHGLEQLQVPMSTVATDLVSAQPVVRDRGDAVAAVLESINFPPIARPILRDGMALIDGGVLNNLPADILPARGADLIVGVNVTAKLHKRFAGLAPGAGSNGVLRRPKLVETLWRVTEVQDFGVSSLRTTGLIDVMIAPDTAPFEFVDFSQGIPLAEAGEAAAEEVIPQLKQMMTDLEQRS